MPGLKVRVLLVRDLPDGLLEQLLPQAMEQLAGPRPDRRARADLERWAGLVTGRGACHHPDGSVRFIRSALRVFAAEAGLHERGRCSGTDPRPFLPVPAGGPTSDMDWS